MDIHASERLHEHNRADRAEGPTERGIQLAWIPERPPHARIVAGTEYRYVTGTIRTHQPSPQYP